LPAPRLALWFRPIVAGKDSGAATRRRDRGDAKAGWSKADDQVSALAVRLPPLAVPAQQARLLRSDLPGFSGAGAGLMLLRHRDNGARHLDGAAPRSTNNGKRVGTARIRTADIEARSRCFAEGACVHPTHPTELLRIERTRIRFAAR
jgi:hypothetical protein